MASVYGMGADQVLSLEVILPNGRFVTADKDNHPDIFWAMRRGGGSTFGVVVSAIVATYPKLPVTTLFYNFTPRPLAATSPPPPSGPAWTPSGTPSSPTTKPGTPATSDSPASPRRLQELHLPHQRAPRPPTRPPANSPATKHRSSRSSPPSASPSPRYTMNTPPSTPPSSTPSPLPAKQ